MSSWAHDVYRKYDESARAEGTKQCTMCGLRHESEKRLWKCRRCGQKMCVTYVFVDKERKCFFHVPGLRLADGSSYRCGQVEIDPDHREVEFR